MAKTRTQQQSEKIVVKAQDEITGQASEPAETAIGDCDRIKEGVRPAYRTYLEARKGLAEAFKQRVRQDQEAYRQAEQRYQLCEEAIEMAIKVREKAEMDALDAYREDVDKAVNQASQAYKDKMKQARIECKQRVMDAWRDSIETSTQITGFFEQDRNMKSPQDEGIQFREMILQPKRSFLTVIQRVVLGRPTFERAGKGR